MTTPDRVDRRPRGEITAKAAYHTYELLMCGDPSVTLADVRDQFRIVAKEWSAPFPVIWSQFPLDAAVCIVAGIDPETGDSLEDKEKALSRYEQRTDWHLDRLRGEFSFLMAHPIIQRELAREAANSNSQKS